jgi:hypothetical protein
LNDIKKISSELADLITRAMSLNILPECDFHDMKNILLPQSLLNKIHFDLQCLISTKDKSNFDPTHWSLLEVIHVKLHQFEVLQSKFNSSLTNHCLIYAFSDRKRQNLEIEDYSQFSTAFDSSELYLGYSTLGKSLFTSFLDNDLNLIKNRQVTPQLSFSSEVITIFSETKYLTPAEKHQRNLSNYHKWCKQNEIHKFGYDYEAPQHSPGHACLGFTSTKVNSLLLAQILQNDPLLEARTSY